MCMTANIYIYIKSMFQYLCTTNIFIVFMDMSSYYVCIHTYIHIYTHTHIYIYMCVYVCVYVDVSLSFFHY